MSVRSVFPPRAVIQSATPADRTSSHRRIVRSSVVRAWASKKCAHASGAARAAEALPCLGAHQRGPKPWILVGFRAPILVDAGLPVARRGDRGRPNSVKIKVAISLVLWLKTRPMHYACQIYLGFLFWVTMIYTPKMTKMASFFFKYTT